MSIEAVAHRGGTARFWGSRRKLNRRAKDRLIADHEGGCHTLLGEGPQVLCPLCQGGR
jgi:hypothetical protein